MNDAVFKTAGPLTARRLRTGLGIALVAACATGALNAGLSADGWSFGPSPAYARGGDDRGGDDRGGDDRGGDDRGGDDRGGHGRGADDRGGDDHGRGGRGADDAAGDDHGRGGHGADDRAGDDHGRRGRGRDDARLSDPVGAPGGAVAKVERTAAGFEIEYVSGWKVEVENGRFELKNPAGRTVEQRPAAPADMALWRRS